MNLFHFASSIAGAALAGFLLSSTVRAAPPQTLESSIQTAAFGDPGFEAFMDGAVRAQMDAQMIPGLAIAVTHGDRVVFLKGYGYADIERKIPVDPGKHLFRIASVSKPFTWMSLIQLAERGKLKLDADVNDYLNFKIADTFPEKPVRIRNLITHTTGFEAVNIGSSSRTEEDKKTLENALKLLQPARVAPPGVRTNYSNYGAALGGYIIERVSGRPLPDYLEEEIFSPLGMTRTTIRQPPADALAGNLAAGYTVENGAVQPGSYSYLNLYPDGAVQTTAKDMARFAIAHLNPQKYDDVLSAEGFSAMHDVQFSNIPQVAGMTLGFEQKIWNGMTAFGHGGDMEYFSSRLLMFPEKQLSIFIAMNTDHAGAARDHIVSALLDRYFEEPRENYMFSDAAVINASDDFAPSYVSSRRNHTTIEKIFWPLLTGVSISRRSDDVLDVSFFGEAHPFSRESEGVYIPSGATLNALAGTGALIHTKDPATGARKLYFTQIGSFLFEEPEPLDSLKLHLFLFAAGCLTLLAGGALVIVALARRSWRIDGASAAALLLLGGGVLSYAFVPAMAGHLTEDLVFGIPASLRMLFWLPVLGLAATISASAILIWRMARKSPVSPTLATGAILLAYAGGALAWQLSIWNMLGFSGLPA